MMGVKNIIAPAAVVLAVLFAGHVGAQDSKLFSNPARLEQRGGKSIYDAICAACHMPDGTGAAGAGKYPALAKNELLESAGYPIHVIMHGHKAMPALGGVLDDEQIKEVVEYIRTNLGNSFTEPVTLDEVTSLRQ